VVRIELPRRNFGVRSKIFINLMKLPKTRPAGFTLIELLVVIAIIAILATLAVPNILSAIDSAKLTKSGSNGAALAKSWIKMTLDYAANPDVNVGWPGDLANQDGKGKINSVKDFYERLTTYGDLKLADLQPLITAPGLQAWEGTSIQTLNPDKNTAFKVFKVSESDGPSTVFISTKNYTYNKELEKDKIPFGEKGFVIVNKQGNFSAFKPKQFGSIANIGLLPGRKDSQDRPQESQDDLLSMN
jgi:prepilin-type N-terminal cleavage/methylation domain-containing protein